MPSILFVCTANLFRSPIAAACLLKCIEQDNPGGEWTVQSAGSWIRAGMSVPRMTLQIAKELGLNGLEDHRTRQIDEALLERFDLIIVMEAGHKEAIANEFPSVRQRLYLLSELADVVSYDIPDPGEGEVDPHDIGHELHFLIRRGRENILRRAESLSRLQAP